MPCAASSSVPLRFGVLLQVKLVSTTGRLAVDLSKEQMPPLHRMEEGSYAGAEREDYLALGELSVRWHW